MSKLIAVTGGIGSGKSLVSKILMNRFGAHLFNADSVAKMLYKNNKEVVDSVVSIIGESVLTSDHTIDLEKLKSLSVVDPTLLNDLGSMITPFIEAELILELNRYRTSDMVVYESATMHKNPMKHVKFDAVIGVVAPKHIRFARFLVRSFENMDIGQLFRYGEIAQTIPDHLNKFNAFDSMQQPHENTAFGYNYVINNVNTVDWLVSECENIVADINKNR